jgi:hypothetical protein
MLDELCLPVLAAARDRTSAVATAVQFAIVVHPAGAPGYTLRVTFVSAVRESVGGRGLVSTSCRG